MLKNVRLAIAVGVALATLITPIIAHSDNIVTNQWYTGSFGVTDHSPLLGGPYAGNTAYLGTDGPMLPYPSTGTAIAAPANSTGALSMTITMPSSGGYLTVTDVENSGDQYQMIVNGTPATPVLAGVSGLIPAGQNSYNGTAIDGNSYSGLTSLPVYGYSLASAEDIGEGLADSNFSSGTFYLPGGVDVITGYFIVGLGNGDVDLIVEPAAVPEPTTMLLLGTGLIGLAGLWRKFKK